MKTWFWPLNWYFRIQELESTVAMLQAKNRELDAQMRAQAIAHTGMTAAYVAAVASISSMMARG